MRILEQYRPLVVGSKMGGGVQGQMSLDLLSSLVDRVLVLDESLEYYAPRFGPRMWLRCVHDHDNWKDPILWAQHCAIRMAVAYGHGCRDLITTNETIGVEGLGQTEEDYRWFNWWGMRHISALRDELDDRGCYDVRIWGPAFSPGHAEDDFFEGYRLIADYLNALDGIAVHLYWRPDGGFLGNWEAPYWSQRIVRAHELISSMGINKPYAITEMNRKVRRDDPNDIRAYAEELKQYYQWANSLDYVTAVFTFLVCRRDPAFADLSWADMPGMIEDMAGFDRLSEGVFAMPTVGEGFAKAKPFIGEFVEDEIYHGVIGERTSLALGETGYASWRQQTNQTVVVCDDGRILADRGNFGDGSLVEVCGPF